MDQVQNQTPQRAPTRNNSIRSAGSRQRGFEPSRVNLGRLQSPFGQAQAQEFVSTATLDETVRRLQDSMDERNSHILDTLNARDQALAEQMKARDDDLLEKLSRLSSTNLNVNQGPITRNLSSSGQSFQPQPREPQFQGNDFNYLDLDVDNIVGGSSLRNAMSGLNPDDFIPSGRRSLFSGPESKRNVGSQPETPTKSLEFLFKSGGIQKQILRSSPDSFRPWLKYIN